jgi:periplasmic protein TonB
MHRSLLAAIGASLLIHGAPFAGALLAPPAQQAPPSAPPVPLMATLMPKLALPADKEFLLPEPDNTPKPAAAQTAENPRKTAVDPKNRPKTWTQTIREQLSAQQRDGLFYPAAAIQQGLEGEALVLLLLDPTGAVVAARIEESSGHALLDDAALRAVRRLRSLPADAPAESLLPVRFRLR